MLTAIALPMTTPLQIRMPFMAADRATEPVTPAHLGNRRPTLSLFVEAFPKRDLTKTFR